MNSVPPRPRGGRDAAVLRLRGLGWRIALTLIGLVLAWRIGAVGVVQLYSERLLPEAGQQDAADAARQVLNWQAEQPEALYVLALDQMERTPENARALAARAYGLNPTRAWPLVLLAALEESAGDEVRAEQLATLAAALTPVNPDVLEPVAEYWESRGRLDEALRYWSRAVEAGSPRTSAVFRRFRELLMTPEGLDAFRSLAQRPPAWWEGFFVETADRATDLALVQALYDLRRAPGAAPVSAQEHLSFVSRLLREGDFGAAYRAWVDSLLPVQREQLGLLYNGGFELPTTGVGFDWHLVKHEHATIDRAPQEGARGQSLRIVFRFSRSRFENLYQPLHLAPGAYRVSGRYRSDKLYSDSGLRWLLNCRSPEPLVLGESRRILGNEDWDSFSFEAEVPAGCPYQELRLASADARRMDGATDGTLWFDDLYIESIAELSPLERARLDARRADEPDRGQVSTGTEPAPITEPSAQQVLDAASGTSVQD